MTVRLQLERAWTLGERIGGGGFGQVHAARSEAGEDAVAKLVPKAPGAEREMLFVNLADPAGLFGLGGWVLGGRLMVAGFDRVSGAIDTLGQRCVTVSALSHAARNTWPGN